MSAKHRSDTVMTVDPVNAPPGAPVRPSGKAVGAVVATAVGLGAMWVLDPGPLGRTYASDAVVCTPQPAAGDAAIGLVLTNTSPHPVTLEKVELLEPRGLNLVDSHLMLIPDGPGSTFGGGSAVPPDDGQSGWWASAQPAVGSGIPAGTTGNIVVVLANGPDDGDGVARGALLTYSTGLRSYTLSYEYEITIAKDKCF